MKYYLLILFIPIVTIHSTGIFQQKKPFILYQEGKYSLELPDEMKSALKKFNAEFVGWKTEDYTKSVLDDVVENGSTGRAPFALIVDANRDDTPDVIIDGHDDKNSLLICILSDKVDFKIIVIEENPLYIPSEIVSFFEGEKQKGLNYFLRPLKPENLPDSTTYWIFSLGFPQQSNADGTLLNDGGIINFYFENGSFRGERNIL